MQDMKKLLLVIAATLAIGCSNKTNQAQECAQQFLDAFLANEYDVAAKYCEPEFEKEFSKALDDYRNLSDEIKNMVVTQCSRLKAVVTSVERVNSSDTFVVNYNIVRTAADTTAAFEEGVITSTLRVVDGKVQKLNK